MQLKKTLLAGTLTLASCGAAIGIAQRPVQNVAPGRHPNIAAAQRLTEQAYNRVVMAQQANEYDMNGHAQKAKELLDQANRELKMAAETANAR